MTETIHTRLRGQKYHEAIPPALRIPWLAFYSLLLTYAIYCLLNGLLFDLMATHTLRSAELGQPLLKDQRPKFLSALHKPKASGKAASKPQKAQASNKAASKPQKAFDYKALKAVLATIHSSQKTPIRSFEELQLAYTQAYPPGKKLHLLELLDDLTRLRLKKKAKLPKHERKRKLLHLLNPAKSYLLFPDASETTTPSPSWANKLKPLRDLGVLNSVQTYKRIIRAFGLRYRNKNKTAVRIKNDPIYLLVAQMQNQLRADFWYQRSINFNGLIQLWTLWFFLIAMLALAVRVHFYTAHPRFGREYPRWKQISTLSSNYTYSKLAAKFNDEKMGGDDFMIRDSFEPLLNLYHPGPEGKQAEEEKKRKDRREEAKKGVEVVDLFQERMELSYSSIRYLAWSIPSIGFIGTVLGIGKSMLRADKIVTETGVNQAEMLKAITNDLGVAFDTTLIALLLSVFLMLMIHWTQALEDKLFCDIKENLSRFAEKK